MKARTCLFLDLIKPQNKAAANEGMDGFIVQKYYSFDTVPTSHSIGASEERQVRYVLR